MNLLYVLGVILIVLKLTSTITVSWWVALLPFYVSWAIILGIISLVILFFIVIMLITTITALVGVIYETVVYLMKR